MDNRPIGVFDSGLGGLTVVRQLIRELPGEQIIYFGDTGRVPYGTRSPETIEKYTRQDCNFLLKEDVKLIIAACGTVSSVAPHVLNTLPVPALGVVEPAAKAAATVTRNGIIGVIGTSATINSGSFLINIRKIRPSSQVVEQACPLFVPLVENGWIDENDEVTCLTARRYLLPLLNQGVDTLLLGCTHFPLLKPIISKILGPSVTLIDPGKIAATKCAQMLAENDMLCEKSGNGSLRFYLSDRTEDFARVAGMFLGRDVNGDVHTINIDNVDIPVECGV
ncbi:MAG: glutamate racemase [Oscillospiraceae bacterium]|nr:glutamate racemase [Oscillospiraceae bacterium]